MLSSAIKNSKSRQHWKYGSENHLSDSLPLFNIFLFLFRQQKRSDFFLRPLLYLSSFNHTKWLEKSTGGKTFKTKSTIWSEMQVRINSANTWATWRVLRGRHPGKGRPGGGGAPELPAIVSELECRSYLTLPESALFTFFSSARTSAASAARTR